MLWDELRAEVGCSPCCHRGCRGAGEIWGYCCEEEGPQEVPQLLSYPQLWFCWSFRRAGLEVIPSGCVPCPCPHRKRRDQGPAKRFSSSELEVNYLGASVRVVLAKGMSFLVRSN